MNLHLLAAANMTELAVLISCYFITLLC